MSDVFSRSSALLRTREGEHSLRRLGEVVTMNEEVGEVIRLGLRSDMYTLGTPGHPRIRKIWI